MYVKHHEESNRQNNTPYVSRFIVALSLAPLLLTPLLTPKCLMRDDSPCVNIPRIFLVEVSHNHNNQYSGHSFRAGGATDLFEGDAPPRVIQLAGRWKSDAYWLNVRDDWLSQAQRRGVAFSQA